ncbi:hypothetical protein FO519_002728 [Halicephalobus sp. NKZ332]|nr:hypothetical protein FO519_002728 [Halicephalobus sp. NKZ332]
MFKICQVLLLLSVFEIGDSCGGIGGGGQVLSNPSLSMKFYPPVGWTYPDSTAITNLAYLPGQSLTQTQAQNLANGALTAAVLEGLNAVGYPTSGVSVTASYTPPTVNDCVKATGATGTAIGVHFGIVENGAVTKLAASSAIVNPDDCISRAYVTGTTVTLTYTPFPQQATVTVQGLVISELQMELIAAKVASMLNLNNNVQFTEEIVAAYLPVSPVSSKMFKICQVLLLLSVFQIGDSCGGIGGGSGGQVLSNPSMSMKFYPPVGWTYPDSIAITNLAYLPGQSLTQTQAQNLANGALTAAVLEGLNAVGYPTSGNLANGALTAAVLEGLNAVGYPTSGVSVTASYTPPLVNDCIKSATGTPTETPAGTQFGIVENGAVTKLAASSAAVPTPECISRAYIAQGQTLTYTAFIQQATVTVQGLVISEIQMELIAAKVASMLNLNSNVQFTEEIMVN